MEYKQLGRTGDKLPVIGMGSWKFGVNEDEEVAALKRGLELGMRFVDTAEIYDTEPLVAKAIKDEEVFVATKVWPDHFRYGDVMKACESSLRSLGVKSIDLYQLHWPNYSLPIDGTMSAMEELQRRGKIRHIGVSNFSVPDLEKAMSVLKNTEIVSNQVEYSIVMREPEEGLLSFCKKNNITIIAYSPFGHGELFEDKNLDLIKKMEAIGGKYGKTAAQVALSWVVSREQVVTIPKASSVKHVEENFGSGDFRLSEEDLRILNSESMQYQKIPIETEFREKNANKYGY